LRGLGCGVVEDGFDQELGFRAGDQGVGCDVEREAVELLNAGEVLQGFVGGAALGEGLELGVGVWGEGFVGVGHEPGAVAGEQMQDEGFGVAAGDAGGGLGDGFAEGHAETRIDGARRESNLWAKARSSFAGYETRG
jgi:hypothetical protein